MAKLTKEQKERLAKLEAKMIKANEKKAVKEKERKAKTHNLIRLGAIAFQYSHQEHLNDQFIDEFEKFLKRQEANGEFFSKAFTGEKRKEVKSSPTSEKDAE